MPIKKTELYSSLWKSCDALRGGMDASQYKDYVLAMLFIKYVSDKFAGQPFAEITVPAGSSFADMVQLKGTKDIGDQINKKIFGPIATSNQLPPFADFNDAGKLGSGKEMVDRLTSLIAIFEKPELNFAKNKADDDDILGDAYEYLMRHFATESGKSKGQFYTPSEVSRVIAKALGIGKDPISSQTTVYDPTCGSGSLLLKVGAESGDHVSLYGQEKDVATSGLARMNMILHGYATAETKQGNTLTDPKFTNEAGELKTFDYVVANPPFSDKRWSTGLDPTNDVYARFAGFGVPPDKQGDYAYLLHIVRSLKPTGRACCILPHGVLFRGNAEAEIRKNLLRRGYIKAVIGLPANLFYGTGIPACIVVIDKRDASNRKEGAADPHLFLIDASKGFAKDGPKNRLRERDIHKIVDTFEKGVDAPRYARRVSLSEIEANGYNLNLPRYIDSSEPEDLQDIEGHLQGGIPERDVDALESYWAICPGLRGVLFKPNRPGYFDLAVEKGKIKEAITAHGEFAAFVNKLESHFAAWRKPVAEGLKLLAPGLKPKDLIHELGENLLDHYRGQPLVDPYAVYQGLMDYWSETMQDDAYLIAQDGFKAEPVAIVEEVKSGKKKGQMKEVGWECDLLPKALLIELFFAEQKAELDALNAELETAQAELTALEEEHGGEDGLFAELDKVNAANVNARLKEIKKDPEAEEERAALKAWLTHSESQSAAKKAIKAAEEALNEAAYARYAKLTENEIKAAVVDAKWLKAIEVRTASETQRLTQTLVTRVSELAERYEATLPVLASAVEDYEAKVSGHLERMGFTWNAPKGRQQ